eukprot:991724-Karenia_brevis.AAC.1
MVIVMLMTDLLSANQRLANKYGTEFNKHADALYSSGLVQSVTLQDLNSKTTWAPDAGLPIQRPR